MIPQYASALLISDLHLTPSMPLTAQRFFDFCEKEAPKVEAVFILGDLFEYWVGDDTSLQSPFQQEVQRALANLSAKIKMYYLHGNRDFLIGTDFLKKTGMTLLSDPSCIDIANTKYVVSHGDALCTADVGYQVFRSWVRKTWVQKLFLSLPVHWRRSIAHQMRSNSHTQYQRADSVSGRQQQRCAKHGGASGGASAWPDRRDRTHLFGVAPGRGGAHGAIPGRGAAHRGAGAAVRRAQCQPGLVAPQPGRVAPGGQAQRH